MKAATLTVLRKEAYLIGHGRDKQQQCKIPRLLTHPPEKIYDPALIQVNSKIPSNLAHHLVSKSAHGNNPYDNGRCAVFLKLFSSQRYCEFALRTEHLSFNHLCGCYQSTPGSRQWHKGERDHGSPLLSQLPLMILRLCWY